MAVDDLGNIIDSAGGSWHVARVGIKYLRAVSCASIGLCVAVGDSGAIVSSTNPSGGAGAWTAARLPAAYDLSAVSCPTLALCVAIDNEGRVLTSTSPAGGAGTWSVGFADPSISLSAVSCASSSLCVAAGDVALTSVSPSAPGSWKVTRFSVPGEQNRYSLTGVSCPAGGSFCLAIDLLGTILSSTNPTGGAGAWHAATVLRSASDFPPTLRAVSCASVSLCAVAVNDGSDALTGLGGCGSARPCVPLFNDGGVFVASSPTGAAGAWSRLHLDAPNAISGLSCPSVAVCAGVDEAGNVTIGAPIAIDVGSPRGEVTGDDLRVYRHASKYRLTSGLTASCPALGPACTVTGAAVNYSGALPIIGRTRTSIPAGGRRAITFALTPRTARSLQRQVRRHQIIVLYSDLLARRGNGPEVAIKRLGAITG